MKKKKDEDIEDEEDSSEEELLQKTGKTTLTYKEEELPELPKKSQRRIRIDVFDWLTDWFAG